MIGLGTWGIGGYMEADFSWDEQAIDAIKYAIALGYSHIDTAEVYGAGHTRNHRTSHQTLWKIDTNNYD
jgi:diketogulonate reductase-like aldo/keto reductase